MKPFNTKGALIAWSINALLCLGGIISCLVLANLNPNYVSSELTGAGLLAILIMPCAFIIGYLYNDYQLEKFASTHKRK